MGRYGVRLRLNKRHIRAQSRIPFLPGFPKAALQSMIAFWFLSGLYLGRVFWHVCCAFGWAPWTWTLSTQSIRLLPQGTRHSAIMLKYRVLIGSKKLERGHFVYNLVKLIVHYSIKFVQLQIFFRGWHLFFHHSFGVSPLKIHKSLKS